MTLFAPTNNAISNAGELPEGDELISLLTFHAIDSAVDSSNITDELKVASVNGAEIRFNTYKNNAVRVSFNGEQTIADELMDNSVNRAPIRFNICEYWG